LVLGPQSCDGLLGNSWKRHQETHNLLKKGLLELGFEFIVEDKYQIPQLNCVKIPAGIDEAAVRKRLLEEYSLEIGAGLGPLAGKVWRIGLMGTACSKRNVALCLAALKDILS
jgi:alanine-glyoxylate transaminase/serine-glyoxylate transaminase/serine-pyruvate transaminase